MRSFVVALALLAGSIGVMATPTQAQARWWNRGGWGWGNSWYAPSYSAYYGAPYTYGSYYAAPYTYGNYYGSPYTYGGYYATPSYYYTPTYSYSYGVLPSTAYYYSPRLLWP